ncbi:MAG: hypothetical protein CMI96_03315 [Pelagibacteraceae bacterium]|nr:hypothetical protein [Pelagibacteraceae bacterium]|tara:strand:- start:19308 stop:19979 length:672 start_codon:yes stop_codon:yes gene_type:complete
MSIKKKLLKNIIIRNILGLISSIYIYFVKYTSTLVYKNESSPYYYWKNKKPFILAFWHSQLMMISFSWKSEKKLNMIASGHSDGRFGAIIAKYLKMNNVPTSFNKKNLSMRPIFKLLKEKQYIGITPDGPRGPNRRASEGIIKIAKSAKVPIIPIGFASSRYKLLNSWDSFLITYPFSKCAFVWGDPIKIPSNLDNEEIKKYQIILENKINECVKQAAQKTNV